MRFVKYCGQFLHMLKRIITNGTYSHRVYVHRDDLKVIYLSIPKSACTSIKASMLGLNDKDSYVKVHKQIKDTSDTQFFNIRPDEYPDYYKFTFVRNPFDRLVSCYKNKYYSDQKLIGVDLKHMHYEYYLFGLLRRDRGFARFVKRISLIPNVMSDNHFVAQSFLIGKIKFDFIGRFEDLEAGYEPIREKYGFGELEIYNNTNKGNWMDYYDIKTAQRVYRRYRKDIETFGYADEYKKLMAYLEAKK